VKCLAEDEKGRRIYFNLPSSLVAYYHHAAFDKGSMFDILLTVSLSEKDPFFAYGSRPVWKQEFGVTSPSMPVEDMVDVY